MRTVANYNAKGSAPRLILGVARAQESPRRRDDSLSAEILSLSLWISFFLCISSAVLLPHVPPPFLVSAGPVCGLRDIIPCLEPLRGPCTTIPSSLHSRRCACVDPDAQTVPRSAEAMH